MTESELKELMAEAIQKALTTHWTPDRYTPECAAALTALKQALQAYTLLKEASMRGEVRRNLSFEP